MQMKNIKNLYAILVTIIFLTFVGSAQAVVCEITKSNGGGFTTTIESVECQNDNYTIVLRVESDGSGKELSHYSIEADAGTYSNVSVDILSGNMSYGNIDLGPNLGSDPFSGFK